MNTIKIAPSILAADVTKLGDEVKAVEAAGADWLHIDIMDGHFVPNLSFSADTVKAIRRISDMFLDVHLMIEEPMKYIKSFADAGADLITVHAEVLENPSEAAEKIHELGVKAGISVKPNTPFESIGGCFDKFDIVLIMTVEPGFGGQSYIEKMNEKIKIARTEIDRSGKPVDLEVDGGVTAANVNVPSKAGANVMVAGSAVFKADDYKKIIEEMRSAVE